MPTFSVKYLNRKYHRDQKSVGPVPSYWRPKTYAECQSLPRPCPFVGCKYHLFLEAFNAGGIKTVNRELEKMPETCVLDAAQDGGKSRIEVSKIMGLTPERIRQIEERALDSLNRYAKGEGLQNFLEKEAAPGYDTDRGLAAEGPSVPSDNCFKRAG